MDWSYGGNEKGKELIRKIKSLGGLRVEITFINHFDAIARDLISLDFFSLNRPKNVVSDYVIIIPIYSVYIYWE